MSATRTATLATALLAVGCGSADARSFAVTVTEPLEIDCAVVATGEVDPDALPKHAASLQDAWEKSTEATPPTPIGRELRVVEADERVRAWFEASSGPTTSFRALLGPEEVYLGDVHDGYIEGTFEVTIDGDLLALTAILTVTADSDGVLGRVRRTEHIYGAQAEGDPPDAHVACARNLAIAGAEID